MARWFQTWRCVACGHELVKQVNYPKIWASETPLWQLALRARCRKCGARGQCEITEKQAKA